VFNGNVPAHYTLNAKQFLASKSIYVIQYPPYLLDLALVYFSLLLKVKLVLKEERFNNISDSHHGVTKLLKGV
jgi:hypothetical protein